MYIPEETRAKIEQCVSSKLDEVGDYLTLMDDFYRLAARALALKDDWREAIHCVATVAAAAFEAMRTIGVIHRRDPSRMGIRMVIPEGPDDSEMAAHVWEAIELESAWVEEMVIPKNDQEIAQRDLIPVPRKLQTFGCYMTRLRHYLRKADVVYATTAGQRDTLDVVRKIAALAARCVRDHG